MRITATIDGDTQFADDQTITITVGDSDEDTATEGTGGDYNTVDEFDITLSAGEENVSYDLTLTLNDDKVDEPDETVTVAGELAGVTVKGTSFTIEDNDATPTVTLVLTPASINESGATNASTVTATMDGESSDAVTLTVSATAVAPAVAGDLALSDNTTLTIPANTQASTGVVTITAVDNEVDAADKTVTVSATATGGNELVAPGNQTLTITDDDTRGITVSKATLTLDEADNAATMDVDEDEGTYTVVLDSAPSGGTVTIGVASGDTTVAGVAPAVLTFTASNWSVAQTVTVTAVPDNIDNPNDRRAVAITHTVTATGTDYDGATARGVTVTVNDDDGPPTLSINSPSVTEVDSGATATLTFTVQLKPADGSGNTVTVDYADTGAGTATTSMGVSGPDYETLAGGTLSFAPGETSKSVDVTVNGDDIDEPDETVVVRLSSPSNATLTGGATTLDGTGTINDNDPTPTVSVADAAAVTEGDVAAPNPANNMTFAVTLSAVSGLEVTVPYTLGGTATAGTDYTEPDPRSVTITAGMTQANIEIPVAGDEVDEENETITVTLGMPTNATVSTAEGAGAASGTITDDDTRGVSVTPTALTVAEADNTSTAATREDQETYEVVLTSQPTGAVTVNLTSGDESVARINTASLVFDADDWNMAQTVTVTGQADVIDNTGDEREVDISHTVSADGTDYEDETAKSVTVTVTDDDAAPSGITLTASPDSVTENGGAKTITVTAAVNGATRYAAARTVSVSVGGGTAISGTDYTAVDSFDITIGAGEDDASNTFTLTPENDVLAEGNETIDVTGTLSGVTITPDEITLTDDDEAPSGITLSVDTNGAEDGTPSTVEEDAGATVVTVTATVNGTTRYVDAKTVAVSVVDGTAASPADYAAVSGFNITIAAGAASHTGSFTVTPVDDDLDEANETIDVTGTVSGVTITGATVTFTDNDDPVSFSIADAEATEGGKVTFMVSRTGAGDNVASVKVTTATDSGDGVNAADADDYTAIATAQTLNFAKGVASQTVEVQTTQDDLFEPDETFKAVLSAPALADGDPGTGASIEAGKGRATGTIRNDDTEPSFAVADASATEGDDITFTVTRSGAMDNAVSVKWNTKPDTGADAASATDYTPVTAATTLSFAKDVGTQTFTVATTEDVLAEGNETFLVELTGAEGGTISTAEATGTITDDDDAPSGITLSVDTNGATSGTPTNIGEEAGATTVRVTATIVGTTRFATAQTVAVTVGKDGDSATEGTDYAMVGEQSIEIPIGAASAYVDFPLTPTSDVLSEGSETISVEGTLTDVTFTNTAITITDDDAAPGAITLSVDADTGTNNVQSSIAEEGGVKTVRVTATIDGTTRFATAQTVTVTVGKDGDTATEGTDYAMVDQQSIEIPIGAASGYVEFMLTPTTDVLFEGSETISLDGTLTGVTFTNSSITINDDDAAPSAITLSVDTNAGGDGTPTTLAEGAAATTVRVTATITSATRFAANQAVTFEVGKSADSATEGTDYTEVGTLTITIDGGETSGYVDFTLTPTSDVLDEPNETISVHGTQADITFTDATITINDDDAAPSAITLAVDTNAGGNGTPTSVGEEAGATTVRVTATITSATRFAANQAVTFEVGKSADSATEDTDYTEIGTLTITIDGGEQTGYVDFTLTPTSDVLDEPNETISVEGTQANITFTDATITITDDDAAPSGITLSVDTNGSTAGTPSTVAEDAGATVVTVTATVNGTTRYVEAKTVAVSVADGTAASPADYAAVSNFNITIAAGAASHTGSFTVTPVDDDLDESDETIDVTGTLTDITITPATVTLTDTDAPVSFSIADAEATEGGKVTFTVSRAGAGDNVAEVKIATAADSGDGVKAAGTDDYTAISPAQTLKFADGVTSQTVEVQTTQDDLFEPDETFRAVLSAPALAEDDPGTGVSIESGKGTAIGTIKNDDTRPSFAVADASASEGDAITFTVTRSGAMDNAVSVKWRTKADSSDGANAASTTDYTAMPTATKLDFAKGVGTQTFTVATTEDTLHEGNETFLVELTEPVGAIISDAQATGTINDDDAAPSGITLSVDTNGSTSGTPSTVAEDAGATVVTVTATVNGTTRYVEAKTVAVSVADGTAASPADYAAVSNFNITIAAGAASHTGSFTVTPVDDDLDESDETIDVTGTLTDITITPATVTLTDTDAPVSFSIADAEATEGGKVAFTVSRAGAEDNVAEVKIATAADSGDGVKAAGTDDYTAIATAQTLNFAAGVTSQTVEVQTTQDDLFEPDETFKAVLSAPALADGDPGTGVSIESGKGTATGTIRNDDTQPSFAVADASASEGDAITFTVTRSGAMDNAVSVKWNTKPDSSDGANAASATDYTRVTTARTLTFAKDVGTQTFTVDTTEDTLHEGNETFLVELTEAEGGTISTAQATGTITDDDAAPTALTLTVDADTDTMGTQTSLAEDGGAKTVRVTATLGGSSTFTEAKTVTVEVGADADGAEEGTDYTEVESKSITIDAGSSSGYVDFTLTPTDDDIDEPSEGISIEGTLTGITVAGTAITLTDDEVTPTVTLVLTPTTINESGNGNASTVTATLSGKSSVAVTLTVAAVAGADTVAADFTVTTNKTLTFAAGATTSTGAVTITAVDNDVDAPNKSVTVSATASGGGVSDPTDQTLTITDDEGTPTVTLALDPTTINESGNGNASAVTATLSGESSAAVTVEVSVPNNAPVTLSGNTTLTIAAGSKTSTGTVTITAVDNDVDAPNASVVVSGAASGGGVTNPADQTLTITDDEGTPTVTLMLTPGTINESGATNSSTVTATLSGKSNEAVTLTVVAAAGANTAAGDFTLSGTTLTIAVGATTSTGAVTITAVDNDIDAPNKTVTVSATASGGGVTNPTDQTLTIADDDAAPSGITLSVSPATLDEGDGLTQITVTAAVNGTTRYVDARTVTVSVGGGTAISGTDYGAVSNFDITIAAGDASETGTFDLTPTDDALHEEDETIEVTGSSGALTITPATVTITDNDNAGPVGTVSLSTSRYEVLEGDSLSVTVNLSEAPAADTMIELEATSPGGYSATPGADYVGGVQTVTIRAGTTSGKARISTTRDNQNDPNETFKLAIRASELPGTVTLGEPDTAVVTIREPVSGITPPETATVVYAGRNSRILMPVPAGLKGHGIDVAFYFDWGPGTAQGGGDCREPGTDVVDWGHWPSYPEGMVRTGPLVRIAEDIDTDTIELEIELCKGSVGKTFTASWDSLQWLGNPDRGFPGVKSYPFNAAAAHCTSTALCYTRVTIIGDTPDPDPEITIAAGGDITEGGDAVFTVQASPAPASDLEIALAIADDAVSDFLMDGEEGSKTVTIAAGSDTATYTLATTDDDLKEANGGVSATLEAGTGYLVGSPSAATVAVADNDDDDDARATVVRITGGADITEGGVARFTLTGAPVPSQDITVNLRVTQSGAFAGDGELGARPVTLGTDATVTVDIPTVDDSTLEDDGSLAITVEPGTGYTPHATDASATVAVADDEVPSLPTIHIDDVEAAEGDDLHFTFTLSHAVDHEVVVYWETRFGTNPHDNENGHGPSYGEAVPHADFRYADSRVTVYPGSTRGEFWVETFDDFHDEGRETLTVVLTEAEGAIIADELAIGTIVNSDPMPAAWLARFGRAVAEQALDGIAGRIAAPRTAGMQGMIAGQALSFGGSTGVGAASPHGSLSGTSLFDRARLSLSDIDRLFGDERATDRSRTLSGRDLLLGSRFTLTGERDATGGNLAFWGRAAQSGFDGREGRFSLDGEAMTAMLGADYARDQWLAGMALMRSSGKGGGSYADPGSESGAGSGTGAQHCLDDDGGMDVDNPCSGAGRGAGGKVEATLTAAIPYLALQASERVKLWGALGHGVGEVMLKPELGEMLKSDISWSMASLGLRGDLLPTQESPGSESGAGGPGLALVSDALWAGTSSEKTRGLAASDSDVTRLRLGLEGSWKAPLEGDASITPKLEMGMRHDGGDAETGFGVELGGGIAWMDPRLGLSLDLSGRALVAHDAGDLENRGFATSLAFDPDPASERGLSFALRQDWGGQAEGGLDALFQADPLSERTGSGSTSGSRWSAEGAYGFPALSGRFISSPHMGIGLATGARDYSLGWRLTPARNAPDISFRLKATRRESDGAKPEHTVGFEISARW